MNSIFARYALQKDEEVVLSLLDFIVAVYDLSAMLTLSKLLSNAFTLMGGSV